MNQAPRCFYFLVWHSTMRMNHNATGNVRVLKKGTCTDSLLCPSQNAADQQFFSHPLLFSQLDYCFCIAYKEGVIYKPSELLWMLSPSSGTVCLKNLVGKQNSRDSWKNGITDRARAWKEQVELRSSNSLPLTREEHQNWYLLLVKDCNHFFKNKKAWK